MCPPHRLSLHRSSAFLVSLSNNWMCSQFRWSIDASWCTRKCILKAFDREEKAPGAMQRCRARVNGRRVSDFYNLNVLQVDAGQLRRTRSKWVATPGCFRADTFWPAILCWLLIFKFYIRFSSFICILNCFLQNIEILKSVSSTINYQKGSFGGREQGKLANLVGKQ